MSGSHGEGGAGAGDGDAGCARGPVGPGDAGAAGAGGVEAVLIDGRAAATVGVLDRGLQYGDGLFETIACRNGRARFLELHLERLAGGCERLRLPFTEWRALRAELDQLAAGPPAIVKLILTRGQALERGYAVHGERPTRILLRHSWPAEDPALARDGVAVRTARLRLGENPALAGLKHLNRLEQVLARAEWSDAAVHESLLFSSSGKVISGTMSNVFMAIGGRLMTPQLTQCGVHGIMRRVVLREARRALCEVLECDLDAAQLARAQELFLTNARIGIRPVRLLDGRPLPVGAFTRQLQRLLEPLLAESVDA